MYKALRAAHKWIGLFACFFLMLVAATGFLLAIKGNVGWMRPEAVPGGEVSSMADLVGVGVALEAAYGVGLSELREDGDIDRFEFHADDRIYKVISKKGYHEVQIDGATGEVLSVGKRNDQLTEDIHDLSFFADFAHAWVLPAVAIGLFFLGLSGVVMFFVPVVRRWKFKRDQAAKVKAS